MPAAYRAYSDNQLLQLIAQSDQQAYDELYERYFTQLFNYAYQKTSDRFLAQEVVQELFITIWQQRTRIEITGLAKSYIFTTAKHLIIDQYRREASRAHYTDTFMSRQPLFTNQTEEQVWANELERSYQEFLAQLPPKCQQAFMLSRQGYTNREIAQQMGIAEKTVEQHISKALRLVRDWLPNYLLMVFILSLIH